MFITSRVFPSPISFPLPYSMVVHSLNDRMCCPCHHSRIEAGGHTIFWIPTPQLLVTVNVELVLPNRQLLEGFFADILKELFQWKPLILPTQSITRHLACACGDNATLSVVAQCLLAIFLMFGQNVLCCFSLSHGLCTTARLFSFSEMPQWQTCQLKRKQCKVWCPETASMLLKRQWHLK